MSSLLEHLLDREVRVKIRDGRVLYARLWCVDSSESVILMDTVEHADLRSPSTTTSGGKEVLVDDAGEEDEALRLAEKVSPTRSSVPGEQIPEMKGNMTQRKIGLVMVRGEDIVSFSALSSDLDNARAELDPTSKKIHGEQWLQALFARTRRKAAGDQQRHVEVESEPSSLICNFGWMHVHLMVALLVDVLVGLHNKPSSRLFLYLVSRET